MQVDGNASLYYFISGYYLKNMYACFEMNGFTTQKAWLQGIFQSLANYSAIVKNCFALLLCSLRLYRLEWRKANFFFSIYFKTSLKQAPALRIHPPRSSCLLPDSWRFGEYRDFSPVLQSLRGDHGYRLTYSSPRSSYTRWGSQKCCWWLPKVSKVYS